MTNKDKVIKNSATPGKNKKLTVPKQEPPKSNNTPSQNQPSDNVKK